MLPPIKKAWHNATMEKVSERQVDGGFQGRDFLKILRQQAKLFLGIFAGLVTVFTAIYFLKIPYVSQGSLLVNDSQNSALQAFSTSYFGMTKSVVEGKKGNNRLGKQLEVLRTREFYEVLAQRIHVRGQDPKLTLEEQTAYQNIKDKYFGDIDADPETHRKFLVKLNNWSQAKLESDYEIKISFSTPSKDLSLFLTNTALELSSDFLREREMKEISEVEQFINEQRMAVDKNIQGLTKDLAGFQTKPENLISMTSREKMGEYLSDLMVRINEARLKIAENTKDIEFLQSNEGGSHDTQASSPLYGVGGRIESLRLENKMLKSRMEELKGSVANIGNSLKVLPVSVQMLEDKRRKSEVEYAKYKELTDTLAKVEAQKFSISDRFEILEKARADNTVPQVDLLTLIFLSAVLTLVVGLSYIYIRFLWKPASEAVAEAPPKDMMMPPAKEAAEGGRPISVVNNDHNKDPRIVFENAKLKFQLGNQSSIE
jgi:hypothetical protein